MATMRSTTSTSNTMTCSTTYLQKILYLLTRLDDSGNFPPGYDSSTDVAAQGQLYVDWMYHERGRGMFPNHTIEDMLAQPSPRIFSTHLRAELLPPQIPAKVVYMVRNPKGAYMSFHHLMTKMNFSKGAWIDTDDQQGSYSFYMQGFYFDHLKAMQSYVDKNAKTPFLSLYYEDVVTNFDDNVRKLAHFLDIPLSDSKLQAVKSKSSFSTMQAAEPEHRQKLFRKGVNGDWKNFVDTIDKYGWPTPSTAQWERFDDEMAKLKDLPLAQPLFRWKV
ncbi:sulfotransferase, cytosolic, 6B, member 1 [Aphanomyces cochlioides]|nr:sulfotransferase, cytosolic, 6B, member 1 [Aphanomyces cochlioides]